LGWPRIQAGEAHNAEVAINALISGRGTVKWLKYKVIEDKQSKKIKIANLDLVTHAEFEGRFDLKTVPRGTALMTYFMGLPPEIRREFCLTLHLCCGAKVAVTDLGDIQAAIEYLGIEALIWSPAPQVPD
jgi:hypothetical protein